MTTTLPYLSAAAYSVGNICQISELRQRENVDDDVIASLEKNGLAQFCEDDRTTAQMCLASVKETLERADLQPADIDAIVFGASIADWNLEEEFSFLSALHDAGFRKSRIIGVSMQACSVISSTLQLAGDLVTSERGQKRVLVIVFGRNTVGSRVAPQSTTLFSDGAASCLVTKDRGEFAILASESLTDPYVTTMKWTADNFPEYLQSGVTSMREVIGNVYAQAKLTAKDISMAFGTNGSYMYLSMIGLAAGLPAPKVRKVTVSKYAHVFGCDNLVTLRDHIDDTAISPGTNFLLVSWAPYVVGASVLRYVGQ